MYCNTCNTIRYIFLYICLVRSVNLRLFHNIQSKMNEISFDLLVVDQSQHSRRKKRQATNTTAPTFDPMASNFSLALVTSGCRTYDESTNQWVDSGCQVTYLNVLPSGKYPSNIFLFHFYQIYCSVCLFQVLTISMRVIPF